MIHEDGIVYGMLNNGSLDDDSFYTSKASRTIDLSVSRDTDRRGIVDLPDVHQGLFLFHQLGPFDPVPLGLEQRSAPLSDTVLN